MDRHCARELLDRMLILNQRQLATVLAQYVAHFQHPSASPSPRWLIP
jgi:hypothetical protein